MGSHVLSAADAALEEAERHMVERTVAIHMEEAHEAVIRAMRAADQHPDREIHRKAGFAALAVDDVQRYLTGEE